jgi:hypothetical protein
MDRNNADREDLVPTVEEVLEMAVLKAGLMRKENFGDLSKVKWSRSSRTDKGVHSLATVIGLKVACNTNSWLHDPEGIQFTASINRCGACNINQKQLPLALQCQVCCCAQHDGFFGSVRIRHEASCGLLRGGPCPVGCSRKCQSETTHQCRNCSPHCRGVESQFQDIDSVEVQTDLYRCMQ